MVSRSATKTGWRERCGRVVALVQHRAPGLQQSQGGGGVGNLVAQVVGDAAEGVDALEVRAHALGQEEGGDVEVLVVGGGECVAPGAGFVERGALVRRQILGRRAGERVDRGGFARCEFDRAGHARSGATLPRGRDRVGR